LKALNNKNKEKSCYERGSNRMLQTQRVTICLFRESLININIILEDKFDTIYWYVNNCKIFYFHIIVLQRIEQYILRYNNIMLYIV